MRNGNTIVYIGGTGRCGTNVLKDLMATAENSAALPFESRFTIDPDGLVGLFEVLCRDDFYGVNVALKRFSNFMERVSKRSVVDIFSVWLERHLKRVGYSGTIRSYAGWELEKYFPNLNTEKDRLVESIVECCFEGYWPGRSVFNSGQLAIPVSEEGKIKEAFSIFLERIYSEFLLDRGAEIYIDDNTFNLLHADLISQFSPDSIFIHSVRDPRNVVLSMMKQRWCPSDLDKAVRFYKYVMDKVLKNERILDDGRLFRLRIEDVSEDFEGMALPLFSKIGLEFRENNFRYTLTKQNLQESHDWRSSSSEIRKTLNEALGFYIKHFGYPSV